MSIIITVIRVIIPYMLLCECKKKSNCITDFKFIFYIVNRVTLFYFNEGKFNLYNLNLELE